MPHVYLAKNYMRVKAAKEAGFTTCSLQGSSRSAKTYSVVQFLCMFCFNYAGTTVSIIRAGMPSIKRTVYRDFKDIMLNFGWWDDKCMNKSEFVYTFLTALGLSSSPPITSRRCVVLSVRYFS